jgi:hypothetical protein
MGTTARTDANPFNELRDGLVQSFEKLRDRLDSTTARTWIMNKQAIDNLLETLLNSPQGAGVSLQSEKRAIELVHLAPITSDGRVATQLIADLKQKNFHVGDWSENILTKGRDTRGKIAFVPTNGVVYKPVLIAGDQFPDNERSTAYVRMIAKENKLVTPPAELAPLLRETITDELMEKNDLTCIVVMHNGIIDSAEILSLLGLDKSDKETKRRCLLAYYGKMASRWPRKFGFVFT